MSKLKGLAQKELAELQFEKETLLKQIEQTKQGLKGREDALIEVQKGIEELEGFLNPPKIETTPAEEVKPKKKKQEKK